MFDASRVHSTVSRIFTAASSLRVVRISFRLQHQHRRIPRRMDPIMCVFICVCSRTLGKHNGTPTPSPTPKPLSQNPADRPDFPLRLSPICSKNGNPTKAVSQSQPASQKQTILHAARISICGGTTCRRRLTILAGAHAIAGPGWSCCGGGGFWWCFWCWFQNELDSDNIIFNHLYLKDK